MLKTLSQFQGGASPRIAPLQKPLLWVIGALSIAFSLGFAGLSLAGEKAAVKGVRGIAESEVARRAQLVEQAGARVTEGDVFYRAGSLEEAMGAYADAVTILPVAPATVELRDHAIARFAAVSTERARQLMDKGLGEEAQSVLAVVLGDEMAPGYEPARRLMGDIADPEIFNPAISPEQVRDVAEVKSLLLLASDLSDTAQYDEAETAYNRIILIDRFNSAARRGLTRIEGLRQTYQQDARAHTRAKMLAELDAGWETHVPANFNLGGLFGANADTAANNGSASVGQKLEAIKLPTVQFVDASLSEVVEFLTLRSRQLDTTTTDENRRGISVVVQEAAEFGARNVNLSLTNVPLSEVLRYVADQVGMRPVVEAYAVKLIPLTQTNQSLVTRVFRVPPDFIQSNASDGGGAEIDPFAAAPTGGGATGQLHKRLTAKEFLSNQGITFPEGAAADFNPGSSSLMVRNTQDAINIIETMVEQARSRLPKQVEIVVTMLEIRHDNLGELGYDWLVSPFNMGSSDRLFGSGGGTTSNQPVGDASSDYSFFNPNGATVGSTPLTAGLRGAGSLNTNTTIDNLLSLGESAEAGAATKSPGIFALSGVFSDPQFQTVVRGLSQGTGVDFLTAPRTLTKSGQRAKVEIVREFIYPTEFDPPEIPEQVEGSVSINLDTLEIESNSTIAPITPATPTAFETRNLGVTLEVEPVIGEDNRTIDLNLVPEFVEFLGFIDYGADINQANQVGNRIVEVTTDNQILQPIFRRNKTSTSVTVWDGQTVVVAGLMTNEARKIQDSVPILGSLPGIGHLFQSDATLMSKRHIVFFVTVKIVDPGGQRINAPLALKGGERR